MATLGPKNPSATFFWNDWDNDEALKACSLAAQGLWMRMLCIAARSPEPGVVMIGGFPAGRSDIEPRIAAVVGKPLAEVNALIDELLTSGAADLDRKKRIVNRRMVRAAALHNKRSISGKLGAQVSAENRKRKEDLPEQKPGKPPSKPPAKGSANGVASSRLQDSKTSESPLAASSLDAAREDFGEAPQAAAASEGPRAAMASREFVDEAFRRWTVLASDLGISDVGFLNSVRRAALTQRLTEVGGLDGWDLYLTKIREAKFLRGPNGHPKFWVGLGKLLEPETFSKILEDRYVEHHERAGGNDRKLSGTDAIAAFAKAGSR